MDIIRRAKARLESRRQMLVDLGYVALVMLPPTFHLGCPCELDKQHSLLKEGYTPSKLSAELIEIVAGSTNGYRIIFDKLKLAYQKDLNSYIDLEYLADLAAELDHYQFDNVDPGNSPWMTLYFESKVATLKARYEIASRAFNPSN